MYQQDREVEGHGLVPGNWCMHPSNLVIVVKAHRRRAIQEGRPVSVLGIRGTSDPYNILRWGAQQLQVRTTSTLVETDKSVTKATSKSTGGGEDRRQHQSMTEEDLWTIAWDFGQNMMQMKSLWVGYKCLLFIEAN